MKRLGLALLFVAITGFASAGWAENTTLPSAQSLRVEGPGGLDKILAIYDQTHDASLIPEINAVAGQYDAIWSRLYWYTDLKDAEAAAHQQNKPILYLRLMGNLTDEYSCANSRFFRTILYANTTVSKALRDQFILVWISERPVPVITIDYGDGRTMKRTITGNSIHYVLDADGNVVDALPGVYGPGKFLEILSQASEVLDAKNRPRDSRKYWVQSFRGLEEQMATAGSFGDVTSFASQPIIAGSPEHPDAARGAVRGASKFAVEKPMVAAISPRFNNELASPSAEGQTWQAVLPAIINQCHLDENSIALIKSQNLQKYADQALLALTVSEFENLIAQDTMRNNYRFRSQILSWLATSPPMTLEDLNQRVYSALFLTPRSDPWIGLLPETEYTGLPLDGVCSTK